MSSLVSVWRAEHRAFGALLALLEQQLELFRKGEAPNYEMMLDVVDYMVDYADRFHHPGEDIVFAKLAERVPAAVSSVQELTREHSEILRSGRELTSGLEGVMHGAVTLRSTIEAQAKRYLDTFRRHMYAEEQGLFLAALEHLSKEDWTSVEREAKRGEDPLLGERPEQRYSALRREISGRSG
ncbi:MAG TPA: hemerythrin domain-containing protein [Burkholderiales bacterium]|nr:hemerythrin domain-containing protein [Burkholderiales bacterium]